MVAVSPAPEQSHPRTPGASRVRALRRLGYVHTYDILGRSTAPEAGPRRRLPAAGLELHRVTSPDSLLLDAPSERDWPVLRLVTRIPSVERLLHRRRTERRAARFAKGDVAYVATSGGDVAAWAWVSRLPSFRCRWSGLRFTLRPDEGYLYDLWSYPAYRTAGAGAFVMRGLLDDLHQQGEVVRVYGYVLTDNRPSQVLHRIVLGFEQVQRVRAVRVLSRFAWQLPFTDDPAVGPCSRVPLAPGAVPRRPVVVPLQRSADDRPRSRSPLSGWGHHASKRGAGS